MKKTKKQLPPLLSQWLSRQALTLGIRTIQTEVTEPDYWVPENLPGNDGKGCLGVLRPEKPEEYACRIAINHDANRLYTGHPNGNVRAWDLKTGMSLWNVKANEKKIWDITLSPNGRRLASGSGDKTIRIWDPETGTEMHRFTFSENYAWRVAWAPSGAFLVSANRNDTVRIWDTRTPEMRRPSPAPVPLKAASSNKKPPARYMSLPKTWSILHRMKIDPALAVIWLIVPKSPAFLMV